MPIQFSCPHCGAETNVTDEYAGQTGPCGQCGKTITIPAAGGGPGQPYAPPARKTSGTPVLVVVLVVALLGAVPCLGIMTALLLPAIQAAREAARRANCLNNLKQINLALLNYESAHKCFPPAYIPDEDGNPMHSWRVLILPYMEEQALYEMYNFDVPWDHPDNQYLADMMPQVYKCPSEASGNLSDTSYAMVVGPGCISDGPSATKMSQIRDGMSNTIIVVEVAGRGINWLEPTDWDTGSFSINDGSGAGIESDHSGVANVGFGDGSVRSLHSGIDPQALEAMTTISGGEAVDMSDFY